MATSRPRPRPVPPPIPARVRRPVQVHPLPVLHRHYQRRNSSTYLVLIAVLLPLMAMGGLLVVGLGLAWWNSVSPGPLTNLASLKQWSGRVRYDLDRERFDGLKQADIRANANRRLSKLINQKVTWHLKVTSKSENAVFLEVAWPPQHQGALASLSNYSLQLTFEHREGDFASYAAFTLGAAVGKWNQWLTIGKHITLERARRVRVGDTLEVSGVIAKAHILSRTVEVVLKDVHAAGG